MAKQLTFNAEAQEALKVGVQKLAKAVGGAGVAFLLGLGGYVANAEQPEAATRMIHNLMTLVPMGIVVVTALAASFYRLDRAAHGRLVDELAARQ